MLSGFEDVVRALLEAGADVNAKSLDYGTPLHLAAMKARSHVASLLLEFRANVNAVCELVGSPLHCACCSGDQIIVSGLLSAGRTSRPHCRHVHSDATFRRPPVHP